VVAPGSLYAPARKAKDRSLPLVLLAGTAASGELVVRCAAVEEQPHTGYRLARFAGLAPGDYLIAVEPFDTTPAD
jgi:hypothetical protein